jgi:hypothetical protein
MAAQQKNEILPFVLSPLYHLNESRRIQRAAGWIKENLPGCGMPRKQIKACRCDFAHFARGVARRPLDELGSNRVCMLITRFADEIEKDLDSSTLVPQRELRIVKHQESKQQRQINDRRKKKPSRARVSSIA